MWYLNPRWLIVLLHVEQIWSHGMMLDPTNRASLWRYDPTQPANYDDNQYFCGGAQVQYEENGGKCGPCGDNWTDPQPRSNENTGIYGNGIVVKNYTAGSVIETSITLTANHLGTFAYSLCILEDATRPEVEECFQDLLLEDGTSDYKVNDNVYEFTNRVQLPEDVSCERCVLRWHYRAGNSWGVCDDGTEGLGCGPQEIFRSCADISIV